MELTKFEKAAVKRTAQNVKMLRNKLAKVQAKIDCITEEKNAIEQEIELWETPIKTKYGYTSEQILSGNLEDHGQNSEINSEFHNIQ